MKNIIIKSNLAVAAFLVSLISFGQNNLTLYNSKSLVQTTLLNPAHHSKQKFSLGFFDAKIQAMVPGITAYDVLRDDETFNQTMNKILDGNQFNLNDINLGLEANLLLFGFRVNKMYTSFGLQINSNHEVSIPKEFAALGYYGNSSELFGKEISFNNIKVNSSTYASIHAGFSREITKKLTVGIRGKYLIGLLDAQVYRSNGFFKTDSGNLNVYKLNANLDYEFRAAGIDRINEYQNMPAGSTIGSYINPIFNDPVGRGFAFDLGVDYKINKKMSVSASILDIGGINWKQAKTYAKNFEFEFEGFTDPDFDSISKLTEQLVDSLSELGKPIESNNIYRRALNTKFYLGFNYQLTNSTSAGFVGFGEKVNDKFFTGFSVNLSQRILHFLELRAGVTKYRNFSPALGAGIAVHLGPLTLFGNTDQLFNNLNYSTVNVISNRVGLNLNIGNLYDNDNDGIPNRKDKCKNVYGYKEMDGCSEIDSTLLSLSKDEQKSITKTIEKIKFEKGTSKLDSSSYARLEKVAKMLKSRQDAVIQINANPTAGETGGIGEDISQERANVLRAYFVSKEIESNRIVAVGLGSNLKTEKTLELPKSYKNQVELKLLKKY
jgi:outer membrane protein OmpA-like peptidoglycan-associated protein